jgi:hypothetical protein
MDEERDETGMHKHPMPYGPGADGRYQAGVRKCGENRRYLYDLPESFDTQNAKAENAVSQFCRSENELILSMQAAVRKLLGVEVQPSRIEERTPAQEVRPAPAQKPPKAMKK